MKNPGFLLLFLLTSQYAFAQAPEDWIWYTPSIFNASTEGLKWDEGESLWMSSGSKLIRFDGADWTSYDFTDAGISLTYNTIREFAFSSDQKIWCSTFDRVLEFDRVQETWTVHDPSGNQSASNGRSIAVDHQNQVWWSGGNRFYFFDGMQWDYHFFYVPSQEMTANKATSIRVDENNAKWIATPNAVCFDAPGCHIPAGAIRLTDADTTFFDGASLGVPDAAKVWIDFKENGDPVAVITDYYTQKAYHTTYYGGSWSSPQEIPLSGIIFDMKIAAGDKVWLAFKQFAATGYLSGNTWDVIHPDLDEIKEIYSLETNESETLFLAGKCTVLPGGILGELPKPGFKISGLVYIDHNFNGVPDSSDYPIKNHIIKTSDNARITFSNNQGGYNLYFSLSGSYAIETPLPPHFFYGTPPSGVQVVELTSQDTLAEGIHFGLDPDTTAIDLSISLTNLNNANPGFDVCLFIQYKNLAPKVTEAAITCHFDELLIYQSATPAPAAINGNEFTFMPGPLNWMEEGTIKVWFTLPPEGGLAGQVLSHDCLITSLSGPDLDISNNSASLRHTISAPIDPNNISVSPAGFGPKGYISKYTQGLDYTIRFQNLGNDTARNVVISNFIDPDLDILTIQMLGSSHDYQIGYNSETRLLQWIFEDIDLVDSLTNETGSHGFIRYVLAPANQEEGLTISNQADIFFDFNDPIPTNTVVNTLADTLEMTDLHASVCHSNGYLFGGDTLTATGIYYDTLLSIAGFDSIVVLHLVTDTVFATTFVAEVCWADGVYFWEGQFLFIPGTYQTTHTTSGGCDSIVTLILDFVEYYTRTIQAEICAGETYHFYNQPLTEAGEYIKIIPDYFGYCDSLVTLYLDVYPAIETYLEKALCQGDTIWFNGDFFTESGFYSDTLQAFSGCDSILTLDLAVEPEFEILQEVQIEHGQSFSFGGQQLAETGIYYDSLLTSQGCDSVIVLHLTVLPPSNTAEAEQNGPCSFQFSVQEEALSITFPSQASREVLISDMLGRSVIRTMNHHVMVNIPLTDLESGAYILSVRTEGCGRSVSRLFVRVN